MHSATLTTRRQRARTGRIRVLLAVVALAGWLSLPGQRATAAAGRPNIVLILTDDQRWDTLWAMPNVRSSLVAHGVTFSNGFVVNSLCCPSRTSILTGKWSHSTGVYTTHQPHGGFGAFHDRSTIATWLDAAGYRTGLFGKYLNAYRGAALRGYEPPGWDRWASFAEDNGAYYDYDMTVDGKIHHFGNAPRDYSTTVLTQMAVSFIRGSKGPLFLYYAPAAPHGPETPGYRYRTSFANLPPWRPSSYNEADVSDKPGWARAPSMTPARRAGIDTIRRNQYRTLLSVDDGVGRIVDTLRETGRLSNTMILFMSDNGYLWGEHRLVGKEAPYEESIRVPFVLRYDPLTGTPRTDGHLVLNVDVAPTFAAAAAVGAPGAEGTSLLPLVSRKAVPWRSSFLVEHAVDHRALPPYCALRTERSTYVRYSTGEQELYDLSTDPHELRNRAHVPAERHRVQALWTRLDGLCRPRPPGW